MAGGKKRPKQREESCKDIVLAEEGLIKGEGDLRKSIHSKCVQLCHTNLLDYALLIEGNKAFSSANNTFKIYLNYMLRRPTSDVKNQRDLSSTMNRKQLWLETTCSGCVRMRDKFKDVVYSLLAQFDGSTWAAAMLQVLQKSNHKYYRLFFGKIFANDWGKNLVLPSDSHCYPDKLSFCELEEYHPTIRPCKKSPCSTFFNAIERRQDNNGVIFDYCDAHDHKRHTDCMELRKEMNPLKRKRGREKKNVCLEDIKSCLYKSFTLMEAAEGLKVSRSTLKRKCRQLGIDKWQPSERRKHHRRTPKGEIEPQLASGLYAANIKSTSSEKDDVLSRKEKDDVSQFIICGSPKVTKEGDKTPSQDVSQYWCMDQDLRAQKSLLFLPNWTGEKDQRNSYRPAWNRIATVQSNSDISRDSGATSGEFPKGNEKTSIYRFGSSQCLGVSSLLIQQALTQEGKTLLIKATYKDDMVRFHFSLETNFANLMKEVARRMHLKFRTFKVKYLDDEDEWALLASDLDWQDCKCICTSLGKNTVRLLIQDM